MRRFDFAERGGEWGNAWKTCNRRTRVTKRPTVRARVRFIEWKRTEERERERRRRSRRRKKEIVRFHACACGIGFVGF
ncbi:hypothetical protein K1719_003871 [Acacia pycnantha]|nr:hypothetical protein K1719_003871 [Acacia pycnantha]